MTTKKLWQSYTQKIKCRNCQKEYDAYIHNIKKGYGLYCSRACRNIYAKLGFKVGHGDFRDRKTPKGKTGTLEYQRLHRWVYKMLGKPCQCSKCGKDGLVGRQINWASISREYKWDINDWMRLCIKCHARYDG